MPLDEATHRFAFLMQRDLRRFSEREREHEQRGESIQYDSVSRVATYETNRGAVASKQYGALLATYQPDEKIFRWGWTASTKPNVGSATHAETVYREGQARGVPQLSMSVIADLSEYDALTLARLGALVARANGLHARQKGDVVEFFGLFDRPRPSESLTDDARFSVPPPEVAEAPSDPPTASAGAASASGRAASTTPGGRAGATSQSGRAAAPYRSLPPIREVWEPRNTSSRPPKPKPPNMVPPPSSARRAAAAARDTQREHPAPASSPPAPPVTPIREPSRALFLPVANAALAGLSRAVPGYQQGLFVATIARDDRAHEEGHSGRAPEERHSGRALEERYRVVVQLVAIDAHGDLRALEPRVDLVEETTRMIEADRRDGNAPWRRLSARISPKPDGGATLAVEVV